MPVVLSPRHKLHPPVLRAPAQTYTLSEENLYFAWVGQLGLDTVGQRGGSPPTRRSLRGGAVSRACVTSRAYLTSAGHAPSVDAPEADGSSCNNSLQARFHRPSQPPRACSACPHLLGDGACRVGERYHRSTERMTASPAANAYADMSSRYRRQRRRR
jgi:hypothetical protein